MATDAPPQNDQRPAPPAPRRASAAVIVGWALAVPGYVLMGAMLLALLGLPDLAGCRLAWSSGVTRCNEGLFGDLMLPVLVLAVTGVLLAATVVGLIPFLWSIAYPLLRWRARRRANAAA